VIAPVVAALVFGVASLSLKAAAVAAIGGAVAMFLVGWPLIFWMVDNARTGPLARTLAGVMFGATPFVAAVASGIIGFYIKTNDVLRLKWALGFGPSLPYYGLVYWPKFGWLMALGIVSGVATMWVSKIFQPPAPRGSSPSGSFDL
jgi:hypothetical protein